MNVVADTSVVIAVLIEESSKERIIAMTQEASLMAPASLPYEIGNAFTAMFKRKAISVEVVLEALQVFRSIPIRLVDVDLGQSVNLAKKLDLYAYDAYMIEVAERFRAALLTLDQGLADAAERHGIEIIRVS